MRIPSMVSSFYFLLIYYRLNKKGDAIMYGKVKETIEVYDDWYKIPGFSSYDIGKQTKYVRSHKHYRSDSHHIMKDSVALPDHNPSIQLTDDAGVSRYVKREFLYEKTFGMGYPLEPRGQEEIYMGGMMKPNRYMKGDVQPTPLDETYDTIDKKYGSPNDVVRFPTSYYDNTDDSAVELDFSKLSQPQMVKPFTYDYSLNK